MRDNELDDLDDLDVYIRFVDKWNKLPWTEKDIGAGQGWDAITNDDEVGEA